MPTEPGRRRQLCRRQIGAALALGQAVHREERRRREQLLQPRDVRRRQRGRGVGDVAQVRELRRAAGPSSAGSAPPWSAPAASR